jgi:hypothetical protein
MTSVLGVRVAHIDPAVEVFGLENAVMPVGDTFLEVVAPTKPDTAASRYLERRPGGGGYMVILDTDDLGPWRKRAADEGIRIAADLDADGYRGLQLHPRDTGGTLLEINWSRGWEAGAYHPAGPDWQRHRRLERVLGINAAIISCSDPAAVAQRWSALLQRPILGASTLTIALDSGLIRFVPAEGKSSGLTGIEISVNDAARIREAAAARNLRFANGRLELGGLTVALKAQG